MGVRTMTPNFKTFLVRLDGAEWKAGAESFNWALHPGVNRLEVKAVNRFGVEGPVSTAQVTSRAE